MRRFHLVLTFMAHGNFQDPDFDTDAFRASMQGWSTAGAKTVVVEWQTGPGPTVAWYPVGERQLAATWRVKVRPTEYNEQYADFLEIRLMPRLSELVRAYGLQMQQVCVDQQPIQVMRMRRREIVRAERHSGAAPH